MTTQTQDALRKALEQIAQLYEANRDASTLHHAQALYDARCIARAALAAEPEQQEPVAWQRITKPGQVKVGDKLRFELCGETKTHRIKRILNVGTDREEIIYHIGNNWYVITSMAIADTGSHKNVRVPAATTQENQHG